MHQQVLLGYGGGAATSAFPVVLSRTTSGPASGTSHLVNMPVSVNSGDLLITEFASFGNGAVTTPGGWTLVGTDTDATSIRSSTYYKVASGTEGGTTVDFATGSAVTGCAIVTRIQSGTYSGTPEMATAAAGANTVNPNPPNLSPTWGALDTLWIATFFGSNGGGGEVISVYPYPANNSKTESGSGTFGCTIAGCTTTANAASLDPGAFTRAISARAVSSTVAIRPV